MVTITVDKKAAILRGSAQWGEVELSDATFETILSLLSLKERDALDVSQSGYLLVGGRYVTALSLDVDDIVEAIRAACTKFEAAEAEKVEVALEKLDNIVTNPETCFDYAIMARSWGGLDSDLEKLAARAGVDPKQVLDHVKACEVRLADKWGREVSEALRTSGRVEIDGRIVRRHDIRQIAKKYTMDYIIRTLNAIDEVEAEDKAAEAARVEASKAAWLEWVKQYGENEDLKLAIRDEYPLGDAVKREVLGHLFPEGESVDRVERSDDRRVPNAASRALRERLQKEIKWVTPPEGTEVTVGRIQSVEIYAPCECQGEAYCDKCDDDLEVKVKRTAVPVYVKAPHCGAVRRYLVAE